MHHLTHDRPASVHEVNLSDSAGDEGRESIVLRALFGVNKQFNVRVQWPQLAM